MYDLETSLSNPVYMAQVNEIVFIMERDIKPIASNMSGHPYYRVVPAPDGTIYLVDINEPIIGAHFKVHVLGSKIRF